MSELLLLDEHFPPLLAESLRRAGFDVTSVAETPSLLGTSDEQVYQAAIDNNRRVVTENVRDFRPLLVSALERGNPFAPVLFTTTGKFPRRLSALGPLASALTTWLESTDMPRQPEEWL